MHSDEDLAGVLNEDGTSTFTCTRVDGHPGGQPYSWLHDPVEQDSPALTGLAADLDLASKLPAALMQLGDGWFEYGLVERQYALLDPAGWVEMVRAWSHTAIAPKRYTASSYLAGVLGRIGRDGSIAFHGGPGTGRWSYNSSISYWSLTHDADWSQRTTWVSQVGDESLEAQKADEECKKYVPGARD